jgi:hypothetical protein
MRRLKSFRGEVWIEDGSGFEHGAGDGEQSIGD